ncbi:MAG: TrmO family methyltransferase [Candidatus Omnitrophica bacterium]|nr:TrmO family methyltransferase [Candidatus Omnitrophota bacterium]
MKKEIKLKPIGMIHTPYKDPKGMPIQGKFKRGVTGAAKIFPEYKAGLKDIDGFSHVILIYHFHRSKEERVTGKPFLEDVEHGIFAIRSPHRPNYIHGIINIVGAHCNVPLLEKHFKTGKIPERTRSEQEIYRHAGSMAKEHT